MKGEHYKNSLVLMFARGVNVLVSFLLLPYMVRSLSVQEYGTYGQVLLIIEFFRSLISMGTFTIVQSQYTRHSEQLSNIFHTNRMVSLYLGGGCALLIALFSPVFSNAFDNDELLVYLIIYALTMPMYLWKEMLTATHVYIGKATIVSRNEIIINITRIILIVVSIQVFHSMELIFISLTAINVLSVILFSTTIPAVFRTNGRFVPEFWKEQIRQGLPLGLTAIVTTLILTTDSFMISALLSIEQFAIFKAGAIQVPFISTLYTDISATIFPELTKSFKSGNFSELCRLKSKSAVFSAILVYPIACFILFYHREIIEFYLSSKYVNSALFFLIYNVVLFIRVSNNRDVLIAAGKSSYVFNVTAIVCAVNLATNYLLIKTFGAAGAALSTLVCFYVLAITLNFRTAQLLGVRVSDLFPVKQLLMIFLVSAAVAGSNYLLNYWLNLNVVLTLLNVLLSFGLTYAILLWIGILKMQTLHDLAAKVPVLRGISAALKTTKA